MGDRALVLFHDNTTYGPVIYLHWSGHQVQELINRTKKVMEGREGDVAYTSARAIAIACAMNPGNLYVGVSNLDEYDKDGYPYPSTHGGAGVFVVDCGTWKVENYGGYGFSHEDHT